MTKKKATTAKTSKAWTKKKSTPKRKRKPQTKAKATAKQKNPAADRYPNLPAVGSTLTRQFKGEKIVVKVVEDGFLYKRKTFTSLSALARSITGYMVSGPVFFKLVEPKRPKVAKDKS
jgi:hypothetical protein